MQSLYTVFRCVLCALIMFVMVAAPAQLAAAEVYSPKTAAVAADCTQKPCDCEQAKVECAKSLACSAQCMKSPTLLTPGSAALAPSIGMLAAFKPVEPAPWEFAPLRRPPRI
jgi:hypothetical protein